MIDFDNYVKIKNNYCICYFGQSNEYIVLLENILPYIKKQYKEINFYLSCKDECFKFLKGSDNLVKLSEIRENKHKFAYIKEIKSNTTRHPIECFLEECKVDIPILSSELKERENSEALIITKGFFPTKNLNEFEISKLVKIANSKNFNYSLDVNVLNPSMVLGVESVELVNAAINGQDVYLTNTGLGTELYKKLFPLIKII